MISVTTAASELVARNRARLERAESLLRQVEHESPPFTRANTLDVLNDLSLELANLSSETSLLAETHPELAVREAAESLQQEGARLATEIQQSRPLYDALGGIDHTPLDPLAQRVIDVTRRDMRRAGVELGVDERERVRRLRDELVVLEQEFSRNIRDDVRSVAVRAAELEGLPADYVRAHPLGPDGTARITTDYPDYIPFMTYARSERARRELMRASHERAVPRNLDVLGAMLGKRHELARLLGYATWADLAAEDKMTGSAVGIRNFIDKADAAARDGADAELEELLASKRADGDAAARTIGAWESTYYVERVKAEKLAFDSRSVRPYFEYRAVRAAILDLVSELFGLTFTPETFEHAWHPSVETFAVTLDGRPMGHISLDMHPRDGKFKHAACFAWQPGVLGKQLPHGVLVCNFPDPATLDGPALMQHSEVVTFFHEFGHLVHRIVTGDLPWVRLLWPVEWDFIEAPSQFLEEWIFEFDVLRRFAKHVETGETIPAALVERLRAARDFGRGVHVRRQLWLAAISLAYHDRDPRDVDTTALVYELAARYSPFEILGETHFEASFGHLEGYSALYVTYMVSLAVAKDLQSGFANGLMDLKQARRYRDIVLAQGGTKPATELVREFLGRPYDFESFRRWLAPRPIG